MPDIYALNVDTGRETYTANRPTRTVYRRGRGGRGRGDGALVAARPCPPPPLFSLFERYWPSWLPVHAFYDPTAKTQGGHPMLEVNDSTNQFEVHDPAILAQAKAILDACSSPQEMQEAVLAAVTR